MHQRLRARIYRRRPVKKGGILSTPQQVPAAVSKPTKASPSPAAVSKPTKADFTAARNIYLQLQKIQRDEGRICAEGVADLGTRARAGHLPDHLIGRAIHHRFIPAPDNYPRFDAAERGPRVGGKAAQKVLGRSAPVDAPITTTKF